MASEEYVTKDSGQRQEYATGMKRDSNAGKPRFDLLFVRGMPYDEQLLTRYAQLRARGAQKYCESMMVVNCELAETEEELYRFRDSAIRHFMQWFNGETDEDHASATLFNIHMYEMVLWKLSKSGKPNPLKPK